MGVRLHAHRVGDTLIVRLGGDLDLHTAPSFRRAVDEQLRNFPELKRVVVNMEGVHFIDSSGLGALYGRWKGLQARGGRLVAVGVRPRIRKLLELGGLLDLMDVEETESSVLPKA